MRSRAVKIGDLKAHLSRHLRRVREGERVVVLDRDKAVAEILPLAEKSDDVFERLAREGKCRLGTQRRGAIKISRLKRPVALEDFATDELPDVDLPRR